MNQPNNRRRQILSWAQALALGISIGNFSKATAREQTMTHPTPEKIVTHCVGRYLIDLPETARYTGGRFSYAYTDIEFESKPLEAFQKEAALAEQKMSGLKHNGNGPLLVKVLKPTDQSRVLSYWKHDTSREVIVEGYRWLDGKRYLFRRIVSGPKIEEGAEWMKKFIAQLQPFNNEIPTKAGFCLPNAIILDFDGAYPESADLFFEFKDRRDITFDISTSVNEGDPPESLLSREPSVFSGLGVLGATLGGLHTIKEGDRQVGAANGQQWLITAPNDRGHKGHLFTWESPGKRQEVLQPQIRLDLESAKYGQGVEPGPASLSDQEMLKLWESILGTLRLRPTEGGGTPSDIKPSPRTSNTQSLPLGELAMTGAVCPQTGYWQCAEPDLHGSIRLFHQGSAMPPAIAKRDLSFMERVKGANPEISTNTVWRLVKYAEPPNTLEPPTQLNNGASPTDET